MLKKDNFSHMRIGFGMWLVSYSNPKTDEHFSDIVTDEPLIEALRGEPSQMELIKLFNLIKY